MGRGRWSLDPCLTCDLVCRVHAAGRDPTWARWVVGLDERPLIRAAYQQLLLPCWGRSIPRGACSFLARLSAVRELGLVAVMQFCRWHCWST